MTRDCLDQWKRASAVHRDALMSVPPSGSRNIAVKVILHYSTFSLRTVDHEMFHIAMRLYDLSPGYVSEMISKRFTDCDDVMRKASMTKAHICALIASKMEQPMHFIIDDVAPTERKLFGRRITTYEHIDFVNEERCFLQYILYESNPVVLPKILHCMCTLLGLMDMLPSLLEWALALTKMGVVMDVYRMAETMILSVIPHGKKRKIL